MIAPDALAGLELARLGRRLETRDEVDSTMEVAWSLAAEGAAEGLVVVARVQRAGRGRQRRPWASPPGGLWTSVLLAPGHPEFPAPALPIVGGLASAEAIEETSGLAAQVRWPNDCVVAGRKLAGVLVESRNLPGLGQRFVMGLGIDVDVAPDDLGPDLAGIATSMSAETGRTFDRTTVLRALVLRLDRRYDELLAGATTGIEVAWLRRSSTLGRPAELKTPEGVLSGRIVGITIDGLITIDLGAGRIRRFRGEHCTLVKEIR